MSTPTRTRAKSVVTKITKNKVHLRVLHNFTFTCQMGIMEFRSIDLEVGMVIFLEVKDGSLKVMDPQPEK